MTATAGCISLGISAASLNAGSGTPCPEVPSTRASRTANSPRGTVPAGLNLSVLSLKIPLAARRSMARCAGMPTISVKMAPQAGTTAMTANARIPHPHRRRVRFVRVFIDLPYSSSAVGNNRWLRLLFSVPLGSSEDWPSYQVGTAPGDRRLMDPGYVRGVANRASEPGGSEFPSYTPSGIPTAPRLSGGFSILREIPAGVLAYHHIIPHPHRPQAPPGLHPLGDADAQQAQPGPHHGGNPGHQLHAAAAQRIRIGLQDGHIMIEPVKRLRQRKQMLGHHVGVVPLHRLRYSLGEAAQGQDKRPLRGSPRGHRVERAIRHAVAAFAQNTAGAHVGVLQVGCTVSVQGKHPIPIEDNVLHAVLREVRSE